MGLGNSPRRQTVIRLEARKSYALGVRFQKAAGGPVSLTGSTVRFVVAQPAHKGGAVVLSKNLTLVDAEQGLAQLELQASDLDLAAAEYPFSMTLVSSLGFSTPLMKGNVVIEANTDLDDTNVFAGINPGTQLAVFLEDGDLVEVKIDQVDGMYVIVQNMVDDYNADLQARIDTHEAEMSAAMTNFNTQQTANVNATTASADSAANSAASAAASASSAAASAQLAESVVMSDADGQMTLVDGDETSNFRQQHDARTVLQIRSRVVLLEVGETVPQYEVRVGVTVPAGALVFRKA